jgi:hypothetical protein
LCSAEDATTCLCWPRDKNFSLLFYKFLFHDNNVNINLIKSAKYENLEFHKAADVRYGSLALLPPLPSFLTEALGEPRWRFPLGPVWNESD